MDNTQCTYEYMRFFCLFHEVWVLEKRKANKKFLLKVYSLKVKNQEKRGWFPNNRMKKKID